MNSRRLLTLLVLLVLVQAARADDSQKAPTPLDPMGKTVLMADDLAVPVPGLVPFAASISAQRYFVSGWAQTKQQLSWQVVTAEAGAYEVELVSSNVHEVILEGGDEPLQTKITEPGLVNWSHQTVGWPGWSRATLGTVDLVVQPT